MTSTDDRADADRALMGRRSDFRKYWLGESVSLIGSQVTFLALPLTAIHAADASTSEVGLLGAATTFGAIALTPFVGAWVDTRTVLPIMIWANVARALLLLTIPLAYVVASVTMPLLYGVGLAVSALSSVFEVAVLTYLPRLVSSEDLVDANGKVGASVSTADAAGPALGGVLVQLLTAPGAIVADVLSYLFSFAALSRISANETVPPREAVPRSLLSRGWEGVRFCFRHPQLRVLLLASTWFNAFGLPIFIIFFVYATQSLSLAASTIGLLLAAVGIGGALGSVAAGRIGRRLGTGKALVVSLPVGAAALAFVPIPSGDLVQWVLGVAFFVHGFATAHYNVHATSLRQAVTPSGLLGRVNAGYRLFVSGALPVGAAFAGVLGSALSPRSTILVASAALAGGIALFVPFAAAILGSWSATRSPSPAS
jgi:MFS family permease